MKKTQCYEINAWLAIDGWRWHLLAQNGKIIAESGEAYATRSGCVRSIKRLLIVAGTSDFIKSKNNSWLLVPRLVESYKADFFPTKGNK